MKYFKHFLIGISLLTFLSTILILKEIKQTREIDELTTTIEMMKNFRKQDLRLVSAVLDLDIDNPLFTETEAMSQFYKNMSFPLLGVCRTMKRIGGKWLKRAPDGDKYICMDNILKGSPCHIYSFGIYNDWSWEDYMGEHHGCSIWAYDHTVDFPDTRGRNINFFNFGPGIGKNLDPFSNHIQKNGHNSMIIEYLKVDIKLREGGLKDWLSSGALKNVNQLAIELHLGPLHSGPRFKWLLKIIQDMYKLNFRLISSQPNLYMGPGQDSYYHWIEVVFMKDNVWS